MMTDSLYDKCECGHIRGQHFDELDDCAALCPCRRFSGIQRKRPGGGSGQSPVFRGGEAHISVPPIEGLSLDRYQLLTDSTAIYPGTGTATGLAYAGLGLGEAGEVQNKIKKVLRDDGGTLTGASRGDIAAELGDLLWYVARVATEIGVPLDDIARANLAKLADRKARNTIHGSGDTR